MSRSAADLSYVRVQISARESGNPVDPSTHTVAMAFMASAAAPAGGDLKTASWDIDATGVTPIYRAQCLVGPGGDATLVPGLYTVWVQITAAPEVPLLRAGMLTVY